MSSAHHFGAVVVTLIFCSCSTPPPEKSVAQIPPAFENKAADFGASWPSKSWYRGFGSPELNSLVERAEKNNLDLIAAQSRVRQADARARIAGAALLPQVDLEGAVSRVQGRSGGASAHEADWSALISASYEVDFWGRNRATANAAKSLAFAGRADRDTLALTTLSGVAKTYFQVLSLRERVGIAQSNLESAREILRAIQARFDASVATPVELATQRAAVATAALVIPQLEQQEAAARFALALLVGEVPEGFTVDEKQFGDIVEPAIGVGLPAELLTRRPDILAAEANLNAAHADLLAARAALFPALTLTVSGGAQDPAVQAAVITLAAAGSSLVVGATLMQSIFDRGRRRAQRDEVAAKEQEVLVRYRAAILAALVDVEIALGAVQGLNRQREAQAESLAQSERAFEGARLRYREGAADFLTLFETQRALYAARDQFSQYQLARLEAVIDVCKALGGGWQPPDNSPSR